jgi:site-specific DNA recombinase
MTPRTAVIYTRVSSREQEQEGFSLEAQMDLLREYTQRRDLKVVRAFEDVETAKVTGRPQFGEMISFLKCNRTCRIVVVEKTDRLYRNFRDAVTLEDLDIEIHFVKEGQVLSKESKSQVKFMHDIRLAVARNYSENLREEVGKGMVKKAAKGTYPGRAPFGYRNNKDTRAIEIHTQKAEIAQYIFERYTTGQFSLLALSKDVRHRWGTYVSKANVHQILTNPFYIGQFVWRGHTYQGTHATFISADLYARAQAVLRGHNKPKYSKHDIAFRGLLTCAHDDCTVTAELKKNKYVYYRCSGGRGPCELPRFREEDISEKLGNVLRDVSLPPEVARAIEASLGRQQDEMRKRAEGERARLERELNALHRRMDAAYEDKLNGTISDDFWQRKQADWESEDARLKGHISKLTDSTIDDRLLDVHRILELAQRAHSLYLTRKPAEQAELLKKVLLNCSINAISLYPTYRKPFDLIFKRAKSEEWSGRADLNCRPLAPQASALPG